MSSFTPGPWRAGRSDMISECGGCGLMYKNVYAEDVRGGFHKPTGTPMGVTVARAVIDPVGAEFELSLTEGELFANAALIAAAPELLEALQAMVANESMVEAAHKAAKQPYLNTALEPARAAIAKAQQGAGQ